MQNATSEDRCTAYNEDRISKKKKKKKLKKEKRKKGGIRLLEHVRLLGRIRYNDRVIAI